ncbi:MAG TPA: translation initiation factor IF-2 [candidate division Zixibacteria bacterium]|nr:translation initiation factor IF-2 [candidate division Zixibacteria bacterium]
MTETKTVIEIPDYLTIRELADVMEASPIDVIKELMNNGIMANINQQIDFDTAAIVAEEMGFDAVPLVLEVAVEEEEAADQPVWRQILAEEEEENLISRPPVITMLGHVDHGKTSLLDIIRDTDVQSGEAGGITQHIGAYQVRYSGSVITFLDTPGHEAFTAMRARGAQATDIAILVIAADDGMMPQTHEALDHARAAGVPIVIAMNKTDLESANPNKVLQQLSEVGLIPDQWDGDTLVIPVSAKEQEGIEDLLEAIVLTAEELDPRANPNAAPTGTVLEARMERGRGVMATLLVQNGTLKLGETLLVGEHYGRIKAMYDFKGQPIESADPSMPISVSGLNGIPEAGDQFRTVESEKIARRIVEDAAAVGIQIDTRRAPISLDDFFERLQEGDAKSLNLIVKADVQGSLEPLVNSLEGLGTEEVELEILRAATGNITENDIMLASASDAVILGFNVDVDQAVRAAATSEQVEINTYNIIYKLIEDVDKALKGMLAPVYQDVIIGRAEVRQVFRIKSAGVIAGCFMRTGEARRNSRVRVVRDSALLHTGNVGSLKHLQENVREVKSGFEFGVSIDRWSNIEAGDILEFFVEERVSG